MREANQYRYKFGETSDKQEEILQFTRNLHYVFQGLFLAICFALVAVGYAVVIQMLSLPDDSARSGWGLVLIAVLSTSVYLGALGKEFLRDYAAKVLSRGLIVDAVQHLRILQHKGKLSEFLKRVFGTDDVGEDFLFIFVKSLERLSAARELIALKSPTARTADSTRFFRGTWSYVFLKNRNRNILTFTDTDVLFYAVFCNDIYNCEYLNHGNLTDNQALRVSLSKARTGHYGAFLSIWWLHHGTAAFLFFFWVYSVWA